MKKNHNKYQKFANLSEEEFEQEVKEIQNKQKKSDKVSIVTFVTGMSILISTYFGLPLAISIPLTMVSAALVTVAGICTFVYQALEKKLNKMKSAREVKKENELLQDLTFDYGQNTCTVVKENLTEEDIHNIQQNITETMQNDKGL